MDNKEQTNESSEGTLYIRFNIIGDTKDMFLYIKKTINLRYNMEVFRYLVKHYFDELKAKE